MEGPLDILTLFYNLFIVAVHKKQQHFLCIIAAVPVHYTHQHMLCIIAVVDCAHVHHIANYNKIKT